MTDDLPGRADLAHWSAAEVAALTVGGDFWHTASLPDVPVLLLTDGPHGVRKQADPGDPFATEPATCFPPAVALGSSWDVDAVREVATALGREARAAGVAVLLGPGINLKRTPLGGRNFEYFSEDPLLTGALATAWVHGLQSQGVGASVKHFAVNSQETGRMGISADVDERTLRELYLRAFQRVVRDAEPWTVMCAYNRINGTYAAEHRWLLTEVLRGEWGFDGVVVSDWGAVPDRLRAVRAGLDLTMPGPDPDGDRALADAAGRDEADAAALHRAAARVRDLIDRAQRAPRPAPFVPDEHHRLAREVAGRCIVLLRNENDLLPLTPSGPSLAVIGEYARTPVIQGGGSSHVEPTRTETPLEAVTAAHGPVSFAPGYRPDGGPDDQPGGPEPDLLAEAVRVAAAADVAVVFVGTGPETEGRDRTSLDLPPVQIELIERVAAANPRTVVVLSNGGVVLTSPWDRAVPALLETWVLGQAGGGAIADVLFGRVNPSGRLAESIPLALADHPSYLDVPGEGGHVRYGEGVFAGYRGFDARDQEVAYPFGFGLSYTTFRYDGARARPDGDHVEVHLTVTNTGPVAGREVVQVYAGGPPAGPRRPPRQLVGFAVVDLAPGATEAVTVRLRRDDLADWVPEVGRWVVAGGLHTFSVGASCRDLRIETVLEIAGDDVRAPLTGDSSLGDWLSDPRGAELLGGVFATLMAQSADGGEGLAGLGDNTDLLVLVGSMPLARLAVLPGSPLTNDLIEELVAAHAARS